MTKEEAYSIAEAYAKKNYPGKEISETYTYIDGKYYSVIILEDASDVILGWPDIFMRSFSIDESTGEVEEMPFFDSCYCIDKPKAINGTWK